MLFVAVATGHSNPIALSPSIRTLNTFSIHPLSIHSIRPQCGSNLKSNKGTKGVADPHIPPLPAHYSAYLPTHLLHGSVCGHIHTGRAAWQGHGKSCALGRPRPSSGGRHGVQTLTGECVWRSNFARVRSWEQPHQQLGNYSGRNVLKTSSTQVPANKSRQRIGTCTAPQQTVNIDCPGYAR